jgi:hypothetical protein
MSTHCNFSAFIRPKPLEIVPGILIFQTKASAASVDAGPYLSGAIVKLARPWLTLRTAAE